jgi:hypothetical protein
MGKALIVNEELPPDLYRALVTDAKERNVCLNDAAGAKLAEHFGRTWQDSGQAFQRQNGRRVKIRVPEDLHQTLRMEAAHRLGTLRGLTLSILAAAYGVKPIEIGRRPRS